MSLVEQSLQQISTFRLEGEWFGVSVLRVQEVLVPYPVTEVPLAEPYIVGLINVRGLILTNISLKHRLGFAETAYAEDYHLIWINLEESAVALMVDEIGDVIDVDESSLTERPPTVPSGAQGYIQGVYRMQDRLITVLDVDRLARV